MRRPSIAIAWDTPTSTGSAGWARYVLERQFGYPVSVIRTRQLATADLGRFNVLILPDGSDSGYSATFGQDGIRRLKDWVAAGGTLVALGSGAVSFTADPRTGLLAIAQESLARDGKKEGEGKPQEPQPRVPGKMLASEEEFIKAIQPDTDSPDVVAGVLAKARLDGDHWITAGLGDTIHTIVEGRTIFSPIKIDRGINAAYFLGPDQLLASGYLWEENRKQLAYKPLLVVQQQGRGIVVGFTSDPNYRAYMDGMNVLLLNAIFRGTAHARPAQ